MSLSWVTHAFKRYSRKAGLSPAFHLHSFTEFELDSIALMLKWRNQSNYNTAGGTQIPLKKAYIDFAGFYDKKVIVAAIGSCLIQGIELQHSYSMVVWLSWKTQNMPFLDWISHKKCMCPKQRK